MSKGRGVKLVSISDSTWLQLAYLLVSKLKASFAFSSMSRRLAGGSLNLVQHSSANASADSHSPVDLRPPDFFHPPLEF